VTSIFDDAADLSERWTYQNSLAPTDRGFHMWSQSLWSAWDMSSPRDRAKEYEDFFQSSPKGVVPRIEGHRNCLPVPRRLAGTACGTRSSRSDSRMAPLTKLTSSRYRRLLAACSIRPSSSSPRLARNSNREHFTSPCGRGLAVDRLLGRHHYIPSTGRVVTRVTVVKLIPVQR
jgi:hypothetical protein